MQKSIFQSEVTEVKDLLAETFGRGCVIKYRQPSFSERNKFEVEKLNQQRNRQAGRYLHLEQQTDRDEQTRWRMDKSKEFDKIDEINSKICGLIKSISASCQKKMPIGMKYPEPVRGKQAEESSHISKAKYLDHQKTEKKMKSHLDSSQPNFKLLEHSLLESKQSKYTLSSFDWQNQDNSENNENECDDEFNERLQKINEKINNYENKLKTNESKMNSKKEKPSMREFKDYNNVQKTPKKDEKPHLSSKLSHNKLKYILNEKQNEVIASQKPYAKYGDKKEVINRKLNFFNEKYAQFESKKMKEEIVKQTKPYQRDVFQPQRKESQSHKANHQISLINNQLLSYKTTFIKQLVKQIALDQDFRHAKHMFGGIECLSDESSRISNERWGNLQRQLKREGFNMPIAEVREIFLPRDDEIDPFMSVSHSHDELVHGVIFAYRASQKNWNDNMYHSWSIWQLKESKFTAQSLDQSRRGSITLEDLTFYLNTQLDGSYRNRDLLLIFNRLKSSKARVKEEQSTIKFKDILDKLISA